MAREFAQLRVAILADPDFRNLGFRAQHLYFVMLGHPTLNYVGVADWRPSRLLPFCHDWTLNDLYMGACELADKAWLVFDQDSEEVLVRSFLRHDPVLKQPRLAVSMVRSYAEVSSAMLRAAIVFELRRLRVERPDLKAWGDERVLGLLDHEALNGKEIAGDFDVPLGVDLGVDLGVGLGVTLGTVSGQFGGDLPQTSLNVSGLPTTSTATSTSTSNIQPTPKQISTTTDSGRWSA